MSNNEDLNRALTILVRIGMIYLFIPLIFLSGGLILFAIPVLRAKSDKGGEITQ